MDFSALIESGNSAVGQIVLSIAAMAVGWFGPRVALWAYDTVMSMLDGGSARSEGRTVDWGDGSFTHMTDQEYEDYEYHRQREESRWS